ncbi:MAG: hypothetical protein AAB593_02535 [Patescibacteria group bacterium]
MKNFNKSLRSLSIITMAIVLAIGINIAFATWSGPLQNPPDGNVASPLNISSNAQTLQGSKTINGNQITDILTLGLGTAINGILGVNGITQFFSTPISAIFDGKVGIGTISPSTGGEQDLKLDIEGAVGAKYYCDENGNNCSSAPFGGGGGGGGFSLGNWEIRGINTTYQAATDGFVVTANKPPSGVHYGYTDSNSNPITLRTANDSQGDAEGIMMPVKKGDYWRIYQPSPIGTSNNVYWLPIIGGGGGNSIAFLANKNGINQLVLSPNNNIEWDKITFENEEFDIGNYYNNTTSRWTPPAGIYYIGGSYTQATGPRDMLIALSKNGAKIKEDYGNSNSGAGGSVPFGVLVSVDGTDYLELHAGFGGDTTILGDSAKTYFYGFKIESDGGGGSGSGWVDDDLNSTANFDTSCEYRWTSSSNPICDPMAKHYMTRVGNTSMYYEQDAYNFAMFSSNRKNIVVNRNQVGHVNSCAVNNLQKRC